jgi:hypothetical protein
MSVLGPRRRQAWVLGVVGIATVTAGALTVFPAAAAGGAGGLHGAAARASALRAAQSSSSHGSPDIETVNTLNAYGLERSFPGLTVPGGALAAAEAQAAALPTVTATWNELSNQPYNEQPAGYNDPIWSNVGAGFGIASGRVTALAADGSTLYAGFADGGVWSSGNGGSSWTPMNDQLGTLSIGALAVNTDHSLWIGTGEANTNADSYAGQGVLRYNGTTFTTVGGSELSGATVYRVLFDGFGAVYAATSHGLWRRTASDLTSAWTLVLQPDPNPTSNPYHTGFITDVVVEPGTSGATVLAADGWRGAGNTPSGDTAYNGFYVSTDHGATFNEITPSGAINTADIGRTTFAYASDGSKLYAMIQSPADLIAGKSSVLQGIFLSANGNPAGPWTLVADGTTLCNSGSGLKTAPACDGYAPGVQAWYNQSLIVDPSNPIHVFAGLEEEYQSFDAGATWTTISPYWNYAFACDANNTCPPVTHPDEHAVLISGSTVYIGNDGGVYSRSLDNSAPMGGWTDLNNTLHTLQYYDAEAGASLLGVAEWGGLQDNGTSLLYPGAAQNIAPAGGDGGGVIVDPTNAQNAVGEYVDLNPYLTTDGGHTFRTITPSCFDAVAAPIAKCDPNPRFIAPLVTDVKNPNHWVTGGEFVWTDNANWKTVCDAASHRCDWHNVYDTGAGHSVTALAENGPTIYAAWCGGGCNIGGANAFTDGIATNYHGAWHQLSMSGLPSRYIQGLTVDPANPAHVYAVFNGYSRRWIPSAGVGHVFESFDGGASWTNISGNLPDIPSDALVLSSGKLVLATDIGAFIANSGGGATTSWSRLGSNLPNTSINNLRLNPDGSTLLAATHGRGLWSVTLP